MREFSKTSAWRLYVPRSLAGAVGLILLTASVLKATDMELFIQQIKGYGIMSHPLLLTVSAWGLIALQCTLGVGLLVFYRPRVILSLTAFLWLVLLGATSWAWLTGATQECGCYGAWLKHTPQQATVENLSLLTATVIAWLWHRHVQVAQSPVKTWSVAAACVIGLALPLAVGFPISAMIRSQNISSGVDIGHVGIQELDDIDLRQGVYLIVLMSTDCPHCQEVLPKIDILAESSDLPEVIGLCPNDESQRLKFVEGFQPVFRMGQIREDVFWRLLGNGDLPRLMLLRDGLVEQVWDETVPDEGMIKEALDKCGYKKYYVVTYSNGGD